MKKLPNLLSIFRIILSISLLLIDMFSWPWILIYVICGATDILDGYLARKFHLTSNLGAKLDSLADFSMVTSVILKLVVTQPIPLAILVLSSVTFFIKILSLVLGMLRFGTLAWVHTYANKVAGSCVFVVFPVYFLLKELRIYLFGVLSVIVILAAVEELLIIATAKKYNPNTKSIFQKK